MTKEEIVKQVKDIIVDKLGVEESAVTESASFTNDLGADSLDTVELLMEFERVFGIKIPDEETSGIATVGDAIAKVGMVVEGMFTAEAAYELAKIAGVEMPITEAIYKVTKGEITAPQALEALMGRSRKSES